MTVPEATQPKKKSKKNDKPVNLDMVNLNAVIEKSEYNPHDETTFDSCMCIFSKKNTEFSLKFFKKTVC